MSSRYCPYRWATHAIIVSNTHALPSGVNACANKTEQSIYECLLGFCFNNIFCAAINFLAASTVFFAQFQKRRNDGWWFLWCYCCWFSWIVNVHNIPWSCNTVVASNIFFMVLSLSMLFEVWQNRMCRKRRSGTSWNFILLIFINVASGAMNRHCIPGLTMSTALTGTSRECPGILNGCTHRV